MNKFVLIFLPLVISSSALAQTREAFNNLNVSENKVIRANDLNKSPVKSILAEVKRIEEFISANQEKVELMAITQNSVKPVKVINGEWPEIVVVSINILRRPNGEIYYYAEYPTSESGDWSIGYIHYFDENGRVVAFRRIASFFNSECTNGVAYEESIYTFDSEFNLTSKSYSLTDSEGKDISNEQCWFNYDYKYRIGQTVEDVTK